MNKLQWRMPSDIGPLYLVASDAGLHCIIWKEQQVPYTPTLGSEAPAVKILARAVAELLEYFAGKRQAFSVPLVIEGTPFQKEVWAGLQRIPYGQTSSYQGLATALGNSKASRAVGTANGRNPLSIIIPCHRVIAADGGLGGYAGGLKVKTALLALEQRRQVTPLFA